MHHSSRSARAGSSLIHAHPKARANRRKNPSSSQARRFRRLLVESLETRWVLNSEWLTLIEGLPGDTRQEQIQAAQSLLQAANIDARQVQIVDHVGVSGILVVETPDEVTPEELTGELQAVPGFVYVEEYNPDADPDTRRSQFPTPPTQEDEGEENNDSEPFPGSSESDDSGLGTWNFDTSGPNVVQNEFGFNGVDSPNSFCGCTPPDTIGAAGPGVYVEAVNTSLRIFQKNGTALTSATSFATFLSPLGGTLGFSDPIVVYNEFTQRFFVGILDFNSTSGIGRLDVAISTSSNPTTLTSADWSFFRYNTDDDPTSTFDFSDYPKLGYNADGYVVSFNMFPSAFDHSDVLAIANNGTSPGIQVVPGGFTNFTLAPSRMHTATSGGPMWFVETPNSAGNGSGSTISVVRMDNPFTAAPTFTTTNLAVTSFLGQPSPLAGGTSLGTRMYHSALRSVGAVTHLIAEHAPGVSDTSGTRARVRWYDINVTNPSTPTLIQQGEINPGTGIDTYFPDADINSVGQIGLNYSQSVPFGSALPRPGVMDMYVTGRNMTDAAGAMQTPTVAVLGTGPLNSSRAGDYSFTTVDPTDDSFWAANEYTTSGSNNWATFVEHWAVADFGVASSSPANRSIISTPPTSFSVTFSAAVDPSSVQASDLTVNGIAASAVVLSGGNTVATFTYGSSPVTAQGLQTMAIAAGAITKSDFTRSNPVFTSTFRYDATLLSVLTTSPAVGGTFALPAPLTYDVTFNEAVDPTTIQTSEFTLSGLTGASVSSVSFLNSNTTARFTITGITTEGTLNVSLPTGAVTDAFGNPGAAFSASYTVDVGTLAYPTPLAAKSPLGSLIYDPSFSGAISVAGDTDTFTLALDPGQTITVLATSTSATLQPSITLKDPLNNTVGLAPPAGAGQNALLQTVTAATSGTYSIVVSGANSSIGGYTLQVTLNAALESEGKLANVTDNSIGAAQDLSASFTALAASAAAPARGAVTGQLGAFVATPSFTDIGTSGAIISFLTGLDNATSTVAMPFTFNFYGSNFTSLIVSSNGLLMFGTGTTSPVNATLASNPTQAAIAPFWDDLKVSNTLGSGGTNTATVRTQTVGIAPNRQYIVQWDKVTFAAAGSSTTDTLTFQAVLSEGTNAIQFNYQDLTSGSAAGNEGASATVGIKRANPTNSQFVELINNNGPNALVGSGKSTSITPTDADYYSFSLATGEKATIAATALNTGTLSLDLRDGADNILATGVAGATNVSSVISSYSAATAGTYYVRLAGNANVNYSLVITKNAAFDTEPNDSISTPQNIDGTQTALGYVGSNLLYGMTKVGQLFTVNSATGAGTLVGTLPFSSTEIEFDNTARRAFAQANDGNSFGQEFNINTGATIGSTISDGASFTGLEWVGPTLYGAAFSGPGTNSTLRTLNAFAGTSTTIGATGFGPLAGLAYDTTTNTMYGITGGTAGTLVTVNLTTGVATAIGATGFRAGSLEFGPDGLLYGGGTGSTDEGKIFRINKATGGSTLVGLTGIGSTGNKDVTGLTTVLNDTDDWYSIDVTSLATFRLATSTPADGPNQFVNTLNPHIELIDPSNNVISSTVLGDGRNESILYTPSVTGTYKIHVTAEGGTSGEYVLNRSSVLYWDSDGDPTNNVISNGQGLGGTGSWDTSSHKWFDGADDVAWTNSSSTAIFTGTTGTVTLTTPITAGALTFNTTGYVVTGSTLTLAGAAQVNVTSSAFSDTISSQLTGNLGPMTIGSGTLILSNSSNNYTGATTVSSGKLQLGATNSIPAASAVTLANAAGATLNLNGFSDTIGSLAGGGASGGNVTLSTVLSGNLTTGSSVITNLSTTAGLAVGMSVTGIGIPLGATIVSIVPPTSIAISLAATATLFGSPITFSGTLTTGGLNTSTTYGGVISGAGGVTKQGTGTWTLGGLNTYSGSTTWSTGNLLLATSSSGTPGTAGPLGVGTLVINSTGSISASGAPCTIGNAITVGASFSVGGSLAFTMTGPLTLTSSRSIATSNTATTTISGNIGGAFTFTKTASGILLLSGANSYGGTTVSQGTLLVGSTTAIPSPSAVSMLNTAGATLNLNNFSITIGSLSGGGATGGNVTLGSGTLTTGGTNTNTTYTGIISGSGGMTKVGTGTFTLTGANTYTGTTLISAGSLSLGIALATGSLSPSSSIINNATLNITRNNAATQGVDFGFISSSISGSGIVQINGNGTALVTLNQPNTYAGRTSLVAGTLSFDSILNVGAGPSSLGAPTNVSNGIIFFGTPGTVPATLLYTGAGNTTDRVIQLNTTTGGVTIDQSGGGLLKFTSNFTATGAGSKTLTLQGSTLGTGEISGAIADNSSTNKTSLTKSGTGTWTLSGTSTYTGPTTVNGGSLVVTGNISSSATTVNSGGTLAGTGTTDGVTVNSGGTLAPGVGPGIINTGNIGFAFGSTYSIELNGTNAGSDYDQANVTGAVTVNNATLNATLGFASSVGDSFVIMNNDDVDPVSGTFNGLPEGTVFTPIGAPAGDHYQITYVGGTGNDVVITHIQSPLVAPPTDQQSVEGSLAAFGLGSFSDADGGPWSVDVNWGDGSPHTGFAVSSSGPLGQQSHNYADESSRTVIVTVTDSSNLAASASFMVNVADAIPTVTADSAAVSAAENASASNSGTWSDYDDAVTLSASAGAVIENADGTWSWSGTGDDDQPYKVTITATNADGSAAIATFDVSFTDVAPTVAADSANVSSNEGQNASNTGSFADYDDVVTLSSSEGTISKSGEIGGTWSWSNHYGDNGSHVIFVTATNADGNTATTSFTVIVNNVAPTATPNQYSTPQAAALSGNVITDNTGSGSDSDPAGANDPLTVTSHTDPVNGTVVIADGGAFTYTPTSTFAGTDSFTYTISDGDGGSATATVIIYVSAAAPGSIQTIPDTCLGGTALLITGTAASDTIIVEPGSTSSTLKITFNGVSTTVTRPSGRIIVTGGDGDDNIQIVGAVANPDWLYGDAGNDRLNAGNGGSLLIGGDGDDQLLGGGGRDIMVGGEGADRLNGNSGDDILIASLTDKDLRSSAGHDEFWCRVLEEWNSDSSFATRVQNLRAGTGTHVLPTDAMSLHVYDDISADAIDSLNGSADNDWLIFPTGEDKVSGQAEATN